jgi:transposase
MPKPLSDDLRCRILEAYQRKEGSQQQLAQRFGVSCEYVRKIRRQWRQSGRMERVAQLRHGPQSRITEPVKEQLRGWLREQPDRTLAELGEQLRSSGVEASRSRISQVLGKMGLVLKKSPSMPKSAMPRPTASGAKTSSPPLPRSRWRG